MAFKISGNLGDEKPFLRMGGAVSGTANVEAIIDEKSIDREDASRLLWMMAERRASPRMQLAARPSPRISCAFSITALGMITGILSFPVIGHWVQDNPAAQS